MISNIDRFQKGGYKMAAKSAKDDARFEEKQQGTARDDGQKSRVAGTTESRERP